MNTAGRIAVYLGIILIGLGLIIGFGAMIQNSDENAVLWLSLVPLGFIILLAGTVTSQLFSAKRDDKTDVEHHL